MKRIPLVLSLLSCSVMADVAEYKGKISDILLGKSDVVKVGIVEEDENDVACLSAEDQPWKFTFERGHSYSKEWFDMLNLVRRTSETIRIGYVENEHSECAIEYLALLKGDNNDGYDGGDQINDSLERTGKYGNIALIYRNGLTEASYTASNYYGSDEPVSAFDGYIFNEQIEDAVGDLINRGIWLVKKSTKEEEDEAGAETEYWLQIEFNAPVNISGFRVVINQKSVELGRSPRHVSILTSFDGIEFEEQGQYTLSKSIDQRANLPEKTEAKIFRIKVNSNFGDSFIEIDELEVYAN
ncbi:hypothetical protein AADZ91_08320 [Colwelliaceae bacterium 6441]